MMKTEAKAIRVLVAEDNEDHLFLTKRALRAVPDVEVEVWGVVDGAEALDFLHRRGRHAGRERPDIIFLDLRMPRRSGLEVLDEIKSDPELKTIPVVVLSGSDNPQEIAAAYIAGTNSFVTKPSNADGYREVTSYWTTRNALP